MQSQSLSGQFLGGERARVGHPASRVSSWAAFLLPWLERTRLAARLGILHPLNDLGHGDEVNVVVLAADLIDPEEESVHKLGIVLQPSGVEEESEGGAVLSVMAIEIMIQEGIELFSRQNVGARINHGTAGKIFIKVGVLPTIQLVHDQLPNGVASGRALLQVSVAPVRHAEVQRVRPQWRVLQRGRDRRIVKESLLLHHGELVVASYAQVRCPHADHRVVSNIGEFVDD